ncbi:MAG: EscU/YscU/HrcU family type III secretion system export apparatus switch protein [Pseudomonadota bacterium]|nr:EscU/YscU/HrcU family type III secretion system export apparatus switch protein [Pseudomonadota bacterium]
MSTSKEPRQPNQAVAVDWDGKGAPRVVASGAGEVAERILETAKQHDVPIVENKDLVTLLAQVDLGQEIPTELYLAVAEVLAFTYSLTGRKPPETT